MEGEDKMMSMAQRAQLATNVLGWCARPLMMVTSKDVGLRAAEDNAGTLGSLGIMGGFWLFGQSEYLPAAMVAAVAAQAVHRARARLLKGVSSWYMGTSILGKNGHPAVGVAALVGGIPLMQFDKAFGLWLMLAGLGTVVTVQMVKARREAVDRDMEDAAYDAYARQQRMQEFYNHLEDD